MKRLLGGVRLVISAAFVGGLFACAAPPAPTITGHHDNTTDDADENASADTTPSKPAAPKAAASSSASTAGDTPHPAATTAPSATATVPKDPPLAPAQVTAQSAHRMGDNDAVSNAGTSLSQLQKLALVHTQTQTLYASYTGPALDQIKSDVSGNASMTMTLPGNAPSGIYALMDAALYQNGENTALQPGADLEHWPKGVVGYVTVVSKYDNPSGWSASFASDIIWSGWDLIELASGNVDRLKSPLVLDLGGHGVSFEAPRPIFDVDGDGAKDRLAWVASEDTPFLVRDRNHNGRIDGIDEMFGDGTRDRVGGGHSSKNGFEALAQYDFDGNGVIDGKDPVFSELALWFDKNHDGVTDDGELEPLGRRRVSRIDLGYAAVDLRASFGNRILQASEATAAGTHVAVYDVWFRLQ